MKTLKILLFIALFSVFLSCGDDDKPSKPKIEIGESYQGGLIAYIFQEGDLGYVEGEKHGLIVADIELEDVTVLLLNLDREILAGGIYRPSAVVLLSDDQCCSCHRKIDFNKPHLSIEIEVDTPGVDIINPSCIMPLGNYCSACARKLFHLYDNEFDVYGIWR